jgi:hypothetical protein
MRVNQGSITMVDVHYGVIQQNGAWSIIGDSLHFGSFSTRRSAERAARRLAKQSGGLPVQLHVQTELGELLPPAKVG